MDCAALLRRPLPRRPERGGLSRRGRTPRAPDDSLRIVFVGRAESARACLLLRAFGAAAWASRRASGRRPTPEEVDPLLFDPEGIEIAGQVDDATEWKLLGEADILCAPSAGGRELRDGPPRSVRVRHAGGGVRHRRAAETWSGTARTAYWCRSATRSRWRELLELASDPKRRGRDRQGRAARAPSGSRGRTSPRRSNRGVRGGAGRARAGRPCGESRAAPRRRAHRARSTRGPQSGCRRSSRSPRRTAAARLRAPRAPRADQGGGPWPAPGSPPWRSSEGRSNRSAARIVAATPGGCRGLRAHVRGRCCSAPRRGARSCAPPCPAPACAARGRTRDDDRRADVGQPAARLGEPRGR